MLKLIIIGLALLQSRALYAGTQTIEIATIIPDGTQAAEALREFGKAVDAATNRGVNFKFKWGGSAGTDPEILTGIRSGKFHGAMFAGQIMDQVAPLTRQGEVPFQFGADRQRARAFIAKNAAPWNKSIEKAGFHNLGFYEVGFVYLIGKKPIHAISDIKGSKIWLWPGDKLGRTVIEDLKGNPVEIPVQDSFKAFSEGRIDFAYAPAIALVALQWYTKANHMVADPISYATGSFLIDGVVWRLIPSSHQTAITKEAQSVVKKLNDAAQSDEKESLDALASMGIKTTTLGSSEAGSLHAIAKSIAKKWQTGR